MTKRGARTLGAILAVVFVGACSAVPTAPPGSTPSSHTGATETGTPPASASTPGPTPDSHTAQLPSRASLIQQAVDEGRLDEVTALEYRAKAMFGLPGLPDEFAAGVPRGDSAALRQMAAMMDSLSEADQARLRPYLLRPTQPGSVFSASTATVASLVDAAVGPPAQVAQAPTTCRTWADSGDLDQRFKVWACADQDAAAAEIDIAVIVTMIKDIWDRMSNDMGGPPKPDGYGPNVPAEYGGDARIDFYALHMGQIVYRDGENKIPKDAAAATAPAPPYTEPDGRPRNSSSAFMLMNVDTLERDETTFKLDLIHEFFHALQLAHNYRATQNGTIEHWFNEASATWAETYYLRDASDQPHGWFFAFQNERLGLQDPDLDHQYASYVWPFFMEQEKSAQAIFDAWKQTDPIKAKDFKAVTAVIGAQVPFDTRFRDFAVRNVNINNVLRPANEKRYDDLDANFYDDWPPFAMIPADVSPGSPYVSSDAAIPDLAAHYYAPTFSDDARKVTISIAQLRPSGQVDGDFLAHYADGTWKRIPIEGGVLQFCRDDDGWDITDGFLVVSNHGVQGSVTGNVEISAKNTCTGDVYLRGKFTGHHEDFLSTSDLTVDLVIVWHRPVDVHDQLNFELESGSFAFSTNVRGVCGGSDSEGGPLEFWNDNTQHLKFGDPTEQTRYVSASLLDERIESNGIKIAIFANFDIANAAAECQPPYQSSAHISVCPLLFKLATLDTLQPNASCEDEVGTTWTGHIVEISGP